MLHPCRTIEHMFEDKGGTLTKEREGGHGGFLSILTELRGYVRSFEPAAFSSSEVPRMLSFFAEAEKLCGAARLLMARRAEEVREQNAKGHADPSQFVAGETGEPVGKSRRDLETARRVAGQPEVEEALREGRLSPHEAAVIAPVVEANPDAARELIETAGRGSFRGLRDHCARLVAASMSEEEATMREARLKERRHLRIGTTETGAVYVRGELPPVEGALVKNILEHEADAIFQRARREGRRESHEAYMADALVAVCEQQSDEGAPSPSPRPATRVPRAEIVLHVSAEALSRGGLEQGEVCEIEGVGPVCLSNIEHLLGAGVAKLVVERGVDVVSVTHLGRYIPPHLDTALRARDRVCAVPHCGVSYGLERDHVVPVSEGGPTELDNLVRLCGRHHYLKTHKFWRLSGRPGAWQWVNIRTTQPLGTADGRDVAPPGEPTVGLARPSSSMPPLAPRPATPEEDEAPEPGEPPPTYRQQSFGYRTRGRTARVRC